MELKKYVLLVESNQIMVVGKDIVKREWEEKGKFYGEIIKKFEMWVVNDRWNYPLDYLDYKTSDNILDLVVVGDLVKVGTDSPNEVLALYDDEEFGKSATVSYYDYPFRLFWVTELFKKQPNGDYKRYEIGGEE